MSANIPLGKEAEALNRKIEAWEKTIQAFSKIRDSISDVQKAELMKDPMPFIKAKGIPMPNGVKNIASIKFFDPIIKPISSDGGNQGPISAKKFVGTACNTVEHFCCDIYVEESTGKLTEACYCR